MSTRPNRVDVEFVCSIRLLGDEIPDTLTSRSLAQAVQDAIGHTGAVVVEATEYRATHDPVGGTTG